MSRVAVLTHVDLPVGGEGVVAHAIRAVELAAALRRAGHDVTVTKVAEQVRSSVDSQRLRDAAGHDMVILSGALSQLAPRVKSARSRCAVVIDLFDAGLVGEIPDLAPGDAGQYVLEFRRMVLEEAAAYTDLFLCATAEQRFWLLGLLSAWGRLNQLTYQTDLVAVVPTGVPREPATAIGPPLFRGRIVPADATVILWAGGVFNHYRPLPLLAALPALLEKCPSLHLVFVGASNAAFSPDNPVLKQLQDAADRINRTGARVHFEPPLPYAERGRMYADADLAVCLFEESLETELSFRTRLVDMLWGGMPIVCSRGNSLSELIEESGSGCGVDGLGTEELVTVLMPLVLDRERRRQMAAQARECAEQRLSWDRVIAPLQSFCQSPRLLSDIGDINGMMSRSLYARTERRLRGLLLRLRRKSGVLLGRR